MILILCLILGELRVGGDRSGLLSGQQDPAGLLEIRKSLSLNILRNAQIRVQVAYPVGFFDNTYSFAVHILICFERRFGESFDLGRVKALVAEPVLELGLLGEALELEPPDLFFELLTRRRQRLVVTNELKKSSVVLDHIL